MNRRTVSYTHLDVYKRQTFISREKGSGTYQAGKELLNELGIDIAQLRTACLLYTSRCASGSMPLSRRVNRSRFSVMRARRSDSRCV